MKFLGFLTGQLGNLHPNYWFLMKKATFVTSLTATSVKGFLFLRFFSELGSLICCVVYVVLALVFSDSYFIALYAIFKSRALCIQTMHAKQENQPLLPSFHICR